MSKVPRTMLAQIVARKLQDGEDMKMVSNYLAAYLTAEGRTAELEPLMRDIIDQRANHGVMEVTAISAHPLTADEIKDVQQTVMQQYRGIKSVIVVEQLQEDMLGSIRIEYPNAQFDASLRTKLNRFKQLTAAQA